MPTSKTAPSKRRRISDYNRANLCDFAPPIVTAACSFIEASDATMQFARDKVLRSELSRRTHLQIYDTLRQAEVRALDTRDTLVKQLGYDQKRAIRRLNQLTPQVYALLEAKNGNKTR